MSARGFWVKREAPIAIKNKKKRGTSKGGASRLRPRSSQTTRLAARQDEKDPKRRRILGHSISIIITKTRQN